MRQKGVDSAGMYLRIPEDVLKQASHFLKTVEENNIINFGVPLVFREIDCLKELSQQLEIDQNNWNYICLSINHLLLSCMMCSSRALLDMNLTGCFLFPRLLEGNYKLFFSSSLS